MSTLLDPKPKAFSKYAKRNATTDYKMAVNIIEVLGDDFTSIASLDSADKFAIINEAGTARNLDRIRLEDSIYSEKSGTDTLYFL